MIDLGFTQLRCPCIDVGPGGLAVVGPFVPASGTDVRASFDLGGARFETPAKIVRARRGRDGIVWGLRFDPEGSVELGAWISTCQRRLACMRQIQPYLNRLRSQGSIPRAWVSPPTSLELSAPLAPLPAAETTTAAPPADHPLPPPAGQHSRGFDDAPTDVYRSLGAQQGVAANGSVAGGDAEHAPTDPGRGSDPDEISLDDLHVEIEIADPTPPAPRAVPPAPPPGAAVVPKDPKPAPPLPTSPDRQPPRAAQTAGSVPPVSPAQLQRLVLEFAGRAGDQQ